MKYVIMIQTQETKTNLYISYISAHGTISVSSRRRTIKPVWGFTSNIEYAREYDQLQQAQRAAETWEDYNDGKTVIVPINNIDNQLDDLMKL